MSSVISKKFLSPKRKIAKKWSWKKNPNKKLATVGQVKALIAKKEELKQFDTYESIGVSSSGAVTDLSVLVQGAAPSNRDGGVISAKSIRLNCYSVLADTTNMCRWVVFQWTGNDANDAPSVSEVINTGALGSGLQFMDMLYPTNGPTNFRVLLDITHNLDANHEQMYTQHLVKIPPRLSKITYGAGVTTGVNHVYLIRISDSTAATHPTMVIYSRLYFTDS